MDDIRKLIRDKVREGWVVERNKHIKLRHPLGGFVLMGVTISDYRAIKNIQREIRKLEQRHESCNKSSRL